VQDIDKNAFYVDLGQRVRDARTTAGLTQDQLARLLRLTRTSVANLEAGRQRISAHTLAVTADALNVTVTDLTPAFRHLAEPVAAAQTGDPEHMALLRRLLSAAGQDQAAVASP